MIWKPLVVVVVGLLLAADAKEKDKKDEDKIQGTWVLESEERDGSKKPADAEPSKLTLNAEGKANVNSPGRSVDFTYELDATQKPKHMNITIDGVKVQGIYKLDGDTLTICHGANNADDRPTDFATQRVFHKG